MERYCKYDDFAWLYNIDWAIQGGRFFPPLKEIAGDKLPERAKVLDLCCGTGRLAKVLTDNGYRVTGIDGSAKMLDYAKTNAPDAEYIHEDARTFKLPPVYNAVFSTFNSLNHVLTVAQLLRVFKNVYRCLVNGGVFIFDLTGERHFIDYWKNWKEIKETPDYFYATRCDYDPDKRLASFHLTMFRRKGKDWQHSEVKLRERFYPTAEVKSALKEAGFTNIRAYSYSQELVLRKANKYSRIIFYYAQKS